MKFSFPSFFHHKPTYQISPVLLLILDGWGIAPPSSGNVMAFAKLKNIEYYKKNYPATELIASGESVGLPANEVGNTEVGHLTIGAGRVIEQDLKRINSAIDSGNYYYNEAFNRAIEHTQKNHSKLHLIGLLSSGNVHASIDHFYHILELCRRAGLTNVYIHAFTDGRDSPPQEATQFFKNLQEKIDKEIKIGEIATISGRYYAMDRDRRWERTEKTYQAIVEGKGVTAPSVAVAIEQAYQKNLTDELILPTVITKDGKPVATVDDNDAVIFLNFRIDRPRQLAMAFALPEFEKIDLVSLGYLSAKEAEKKSEKEKFQNTFIRNKKPQNLYIVTMTNYHQCIPAGAVAFSLEPITHTLGQVVAEGNLKQLRMAESEKERFVTYYLNGFKEAPFELEDVIITPSPRVATYDLKPEMSVFHLVDELKKQLAKDEYHFIVVNIANPDMVAHTGNIKATIKACEATDKAVKLMVESVLERNGTVFLTADHGNAEELITYPAETFFFTTSRGSMNTDHSNNPVPFIVINNKLKGVKLVLPKGSLGDIAPSILQYMALPIPSEMTGKNLLQ